MSQSESEASAEASDEPHAGSVYDFLYYDVRRVGSFLSQFDDLGLPTRVSISEAVAKARGRAFKFGVNGGIAGVGNVGLNIERGPAAIGGTKSEARDYDPLWVNALALLDYLETNAMLRRDLASARIGQFVLASGPITLMDLTLFKGLWGMPAVKTAILSGAQQSAQPPALNMESRQDRKAARRQTESAPPKSPQESAVEAGMAIVGMLPHAIQVRLTVVDAGQVVWSSLKEDAMVVSSSDIILKHGVAVSGDWAMLGILDAFPDFADGDLTESGRRGVIEAQMVGDSPFGQMMLQLMPELRPMLGRPYTAFGMTPLLIFREVAP